MADVERFDKAYGITLALLFALLPVALIPILGPVLYAIIVPFYAGRRGGRYLCKRHAPVAGALAALTALMVFTWIFIATLEYVARPLPGEIFYTDPLGLLVISSFYVSIFLFLVVGAYIGGRPRAMFDDG